MGAASAWRSAAHLPLLDGVLAPQRLEGLLPLGWVHAQPRRVGAQPLQGCLILVLRTAAEGSPDDGRSMLRDED